MNLPLKTVEEFPLTIAEVLRQYTRMPIVPSSVFYHYTTKKGLEGILRSGGLQATYRGNMNDTGEFDYAKRIIFEALNEVERCLEFPNVARSLAQYTLLNLDKLLNPSHEQSSSYCACLTVEPDHPKQWESYAEDGRGFTIGFNLLKFLEGQKARSQNGSPFIYVAPVTYDEISQCDLARQLVKAGVFYLQRFNRTASHQDADLTALRDKVMMDIIVHLFCLSDFIKHPSYSSEREVRLMFDPNDGTLKAPNIQYYQHANESIPFIFFDMRDPITGRLPLAEIRVGPKASFTKEQRFLEDLLKSLDYGNSMDWPRISRSQFGVD
jgi:hypothetical protein